MRWRRLVSPVFVFCLMTVLLISCKETGSNKRLWSSMCASCHDGKTAPDMESLRSKYQTLDAFSAAVRSKGGRCMNILKNDESLIRKIGKEMGLKEPGQP